MATRIENYLMERLEGRGDLYRGAEFLTSASYYVERRREFTVVTAGLGSPVSKVEAPPTITGVIEMAVPHKLAGEILTLHMQGGRWLDFVAVTALGRAGAAIRGEGDFYGREVRPAAGRAGHELWGGGHDEAEHRTC